MKKIFLAIGIMVCVLSLPFCSVNMAGENAAGEEGFVSLLSETGLSPDVWQGSLASYKMINGVLVAAPGGIVWTKAEYADFVLRFEFKLPPEGNNGIGLRCATQGSPGRTGMEIQILDDTADQYKNLHPTQFNASIYGVAAPSSKPVCPVGQWNTEEIKMDGSKITITVNGKVVINLDLAKVTFTPIKEGLVPGIHNKTGHIAICGHNSPVEFRNIRILTLSK
ncbi:MAG: DUF1080 domain-containing protein [Planctomycetia bacterium]|nr:DUF1080 domain-containing protein [Planctomycetia bacterium]